MHPHHLVEHAARNVGRGYLHTFLDPIQLAARELGATEEDAARARALLALELTLERHVHVPPERWTNAFRGRTSMQVAGWLHGIAAKHTPPALEQ